MKNHSNNQHCYSALSKLSQNTSQFKTIHCQQAHVWNKSSGSTFTIHTAGLNYTHSLPLRRRTHREKEEKKKEKQVFIFDLVTSPPACFVADFQFERYGMTSTDRNIFVCEIPEWMNLLLRGLGQSSQKYYLFYFILVVIILRDTFSWCFYVVVFVLLNFILELVLTMVYICCGSFLSFGCERRKREWTLQQNIPLQNNIVTVFHFVFLNLFFMGKFCLSSDTHWCNRHIWLKLLWNLTKCDMLYEIQGERTFWKLY